VGARYVTTDHQFLTAVQTVFRPRPTALSSLVPAVFSLRHHAFQSLLTGALEHRRYRGLEVLGDAYQRRLQLELGSQDFATFDERKLREIAALINEQIKHEIADA
jgi:hypothetical protein